MRDISAATTSLFTLMAAQHGVASCAQARELGVSRVVERRLMREGSLNAIPPGLLSAGGAPLSRRGALMAATLRPGAVAISHGAAARIHGLSVFADYRPIDIIGDKGAHLRLESPVLTHYSRGPLTDHVVTVEAIPVTSLALTLVHVAPMLARRRTIDAVLEAMRLGVRASELQSVAEAWRRFGRPGPAIVLAALDDLTSRQNPVPATDPRSRRAATVSARDVAGWAAARAS